MIKILYIVNDDISVHIYIYIYIHIHIYIYIYIYIYRERERERERERKREREIPRYHKCQTIDGAQQVCTKSILAMQVISHKRANSWEFDFLNIITIQVVC